MEKQKRGRKPKPAHLKVQMVAAYLTKEHKDLIISNYGSLTKAVLHEVIGKIHANQYLEKQEEIHLSHQ